MPVRELVRRKSQCVTIAHISDLHFTPDTPLPPAKNDAQRPATKDGISHLAALIKDIHDQQPDILVVTGDIADNPWGAQLRELAVLTVTGQPLDEWSHSLGRTFERARIFLTRLCEWCDIDQAAALFVIPGNHDYRIHGMHSGFVFRRRYGARATPAEAFAQTFGDWYSGAAVDLVCRPPTPGSDDVVLRIIGLDSNDTDAYLNFATGALHQTELDKLDRLSAELPDELRQALEIRVCLVHHHPLPVVSAEALRDMPAEGVVAKARNLITTLTGEQTNMFKNGGTFLLKCLDNRVDLVLHGHQHRSWFSSIQYPAKSPTRLLVAGAASACVPIDQSYRYCTYVIETTGNVLVTERVTAVNPIHYSSAFTFSVYGAEELRRVRGQRLGAQLTGVRIPELDSEYGVAEAEESVREQRIDVDGNTLITRTFKGLVPYQREKLERFPIAAQAPQGFVGVTPPRVRLTGGHRDHYESATWEGSVGGSTGHIVFKPPLHVNHPVSLDVEFLVCNAFEFVREYRRAKPGAESGLESTVGRTRVLYPRVATEVVVFPPKLMPLERPHVQAARAAWAHDPDEAESNYARGGLSVVEETGTITLTVREPLPGFDYRLAWSLLSEAQYNAMHYTEAGVDAYDRLKQDAAASDDVRAQLTALLQSTRDALGAVLGEDTEVTLHVVVVREDGFGEARKVPRELHQFAGLDARASRSRANSNCFQPGEGVAGQAFRSGQPILFRKQSDSGSQFYKVLAGGRIHSVLYCIPLRVSGIDTDVPVYGVVGIGSYEDRTSLRHLKTENPAEWPFVTDVVCGLLNDRIQAILRSGAPGVTGSRKAAGTGLVIRAARMLDDQVAKLILGGEPLSSNAALSIEQVRAIYQQLPRQRDPNSAT